MNFQKSQIAVRLRNARGHCERPHCQDLPGLQGGAAPASGLRDAGARRRHRPPELRQEGHQQGEGVGK